MKRIIIMLGLFTIFTFNSCDKADSEEVEDDCKQYYHYKADVTIEIMALEDGQPMVGEHFWALYMSHKCGLPTTQGSYDGKLDSNGYAKLPLTWHHNFFNNHDHVDWQVWILGEGHHYQTIVYKLCTLKYFNVLAI